MNSESERTKDLRRNRAIKLCAAFQEWAKLAKQQQYPRSLVDICVSALERETQITSRRLGQ